MVRRHGWGGSPPTGADDARQRIIESAMRSVDEGDPSQFTLSDVAADLGVTRQTVYRYFPSTDALIAAVGLVAMRGFVDDLTEHLAGVVDPAEWVVEALACTIEWIPARRHLTLMLTAGSPDSFLRSFTSPTAQGLGREILVRSDVDWVRVGYDTQEREALVEYMLRTAQSLIVDPLDPPRTAAALRHQLRRWVAPAVAGWPVDSHL